MVQRVIQSSKAVSLSKTDESEDFRELSELYRSKFAVGNLIRRTDVNSLIKLWNRFRSHRHLIVDVATGNQLSLTLPDKLSEVGKYVGGGNSMELLSTSSEELIKVNVIKELVTYSSNGFSHNHVWYDRES